MRKSIIKQAKNKEEAIRKGLAEIGKTRSEVDIEVIEAGSGGFLGLGAKDAVVRISFDEDINDAMVDLENEIKYDSLKSGDFDREYNIKDRSKYYEDEARANYKSEQTYEEDDHSYDEYAKEGQDFEASIHDLTEDDENYGEYERLQKIKAFEENAKGYHSESVDLTKDLDQKIGKIDNNEKLDIKVDDPWADDKADLGETSKKIENIDFKEEETEEDDPVIEANADYKIISQSTKMTFEPEDLTTTEVKEESNPADDFKVSKKSSLSQEKQQTDIEKFYKAKEFLENILKEMHFGDVSVIGNLEGSIIKLDAKVAEEDTGIAIGKGGATLDAIELLVRKSIDSRANNLRVNIDINNYKRRRDERIVELAADTARKVQRSKKSWNLKYMNSYERRLAHEEISKYPNLASHSEGQEPKRYVVVDYVGDSEE